MESQLESFRSQGFLRLPGALPRPLVKAVQEACLALSGSIREPGSPAWMPAQGASLEARLTTPVPGTAANRTVRFRKELHSPIFFRLFTAPSLLVWARAILGEEVLLHPAYAVRAEFRQRGDGGPGWHQDVGSVREGQSATSMLNVWTPIVPVDGGNGFLQFIPGSHKHGARPHGPLYVRMAGAESLGEGAVSVAAEPGDVVIFSNLVIHRALPNPTGHPRWTMDFRYQRTHESTMLDRPGFPLLSTESPESVVADGGTWASLTLAPRRPSLITRFFPTSGGVSAQIHGQQ